MFIKDFSDKAKAERRFPNLADSKRVLACMEADGCTRVAAKSSEKMWTEDDVSRYLTIGKRLSDGPLRLPYSSDASACQSHSRSVVATCRLAKHVSVW